MRISTSMIFEQGVAGMQRQQEALVKLQQQIASGRRILSPADDPAGSAQALQLTQADELNTQFRSNRDMAGAQLSLAETSLTEGIDLLQGIREQAIAAGNATFNDADRKSLAVDLGSRLEQLIGIANGTDAQGRYLFSGHQGGTVPFLQSAAGVQYVGDDGQRLVQAGPTRQLATNVSGAEAFERIRTGNGTFTWSAAAANTGTGVVGPGSVTNPALLTGDNYQIVFTAAAGGTTYNVVDTTTTTTILTAQPYTAAGTSISFDGISIEMKGSPASGDTFGVAPSADQSVFKTVQDFIGVLNAGGASSAQRAQYATGLGIAISNLDRALDQMSVQRTAVGSGLREIDELNAAGEAFGLQYQAARARVESLDFAKATSDLLQQQFALEAAQRSFTLITKQTLFDFL
jgi:flagellar hook-associated protein 3 FlgL